MSAEYAEDAEGIQKILKIPLILSKFFSLSSVCSSSVNSVLKIILAILEAYVWIVRDF